MTRNPHDYEYASALYRTHDAYARAVVESWLGDDQRGDDDPKELAAEMVAHGWTGEGVHLLREEELADALELLLAERRDADA